MTETTIREAAESAMRHNRKASKEAKKATMATADDKIWACTFEGSWEIVRQHWPRPQAPSVPWPETPREATQDAIREAVYERLPRRLP